MLQYVIIARDGTDSDALQRRMNVRPFHLNGVRQLKDNNNFIVGGATLDEKGNMTGSVMMVQFETEAEMKHWFEHEPYVTGKVWQSIEVNTFRVAEV
jgi:uncharacterized protein YciI